jgi:hypothetical protein
MIDGALCSVELAFLIDCSFITFKYKTNWNAGLVLVVWAVWVLAISIS